MKSDFLDILKAYGPDFYLSQPFAGFAYEISTLVAERSNIEVRKAALRKEEEALNAKVKKLRDDMVERLKTSWENCGDG